MGKCFQVKFVQTDRRTMVKQYAPDLSIRGHKKLANMKVFENKKTDGQTNRQAKT